MAVIHEYDILPAKTIGDARRRVNQSTAGDVAEVATCQESLQDVALRCLKMTEELHAILDRLDPLPGPSNPFDVAPSMGLSGILDSLAVVLRDAVGRLASTQARIGQL